MSTKSNEQLNPDYSGGMPTKSSTQPIPDQAVGMPTKSSAQLQIGWFYALLFAIVALGLLRHNLSASLPFSIDEAYYLAWSKNPDWGYWTKPPGIAWAMGSMGAVCGLTTDCIRWVPFLGFSGASLFLFLTVKALTQQVSTAALAALLFLTIPVSSFYSLAATTDSLLFLFWSASAYMLFKGLNGSKWGWLGLGLTVGLGLLTKYSMSVFGVCALIAAAHPQWRQSLKTPWPYVSIAIASLIFAPNIYWNYQAAWPTLLHTVEISHSGDGYQWQLPALGLFLVAQSAIGNPMVVINALRLRAIKAPAVNIWFLCSISLPMFAIMAFQAFASRAHANWAAPGFVGLCGLAALVLINKCQLIWALCLASNLLFMSALYYADHLREWFTDEPASSRNDPFWSLRNWPELNEKIRTELSGIDPKPENWKIASEDRAVLAQSQAVLGLKAGQAMGINASGVPEHYFDWAYPYKSDKAPALLLTHLDNQRILTLFPKAKYLGLIESKTALPNRPLSYKMWVINSLNGQ